MISRGVLVFVGGGVWDDEKDNNDFHEILGLKKKKNSPAAYARYHVREAPPSSQLGSKFGFAKNAQAALGFMMARLA